MYRPTQAKELNIDLAIEKLKSPYCVQSIEQTKHLIKTKLEQKDEHYVIANKAYLLTLKCQLLESRFVSIPVRGPDCTHVECFDAREYLVKNIGKINAKGQADWICPLCAKRSPFYELMMDQYIYDILTKTKANEVFFTFNDELEWKASTVNPKESSQRLSKLKK